MKSKKLILAPVLAMLSLVVFLVVLRPTQAAPSIRPLLVPGNPVTNPISNTHTAPATTTVSITYDEAISSATVSTQTFAAHAMQTGLLTQTYGVNGGTIALTPTQPFKPGELVQVSATTGTLNLSGQGPISPTVWQFRTVVVAGSGTFADSSQNLGTGSRHVALGDVDGDGDLDAFVANCCGDSNSNKVWLNNGSGVFADSGQSLGSSVSDRVALGDVDGDSDLDALVANCCSDSNPNKVWLNDGTGSFTDSGQSLGTLSQGVALGDVDGDGDLDTVFANKVWLNDGTGVFTDSGQSLLGNYGVSLGDVDGDGDLDAVIPDNGSSRVWLNDGTGNFNLNQNLSTSLSYSLALGDVDGDGDLDVFIADYNKPVANKVWLNDGTGSFTDSGQSLGTSNSRHVALGDVDGDGDLDAFIAEDGQPNRVWLNNGSGVFAVSNQPIGGSSSSSGVVLGDVDDDGDLDAFVANVIHPNKVWLNQKLSNVYLPIVVKNQ